MPPTSTGGNHCPLPNFNQIDPAPIHRLRLSPGRNRNQQLLPASPMPIRPFTTFPTPSPEVLAAVKSPKIPPRRIADKHYIATMPTVSPIGSTPRHMSLLPKRNAPVPASPAFNPDFRLVIHQLRRA
jgi:hypothetical protein